MRNVGQVEPEVAEMWDCVRNTRTRKVVRRGWVMLKARADCTARPRIYMMQTLKDETDRVTRPEGHPREKERPMFVTVKY